jgi:hypothetical protein
MNFLIRIEEIRFDSGTTEFTVLYQDGREFGRLIMPSLIFHEFRLLFKHA